MPLIRHVPSAARVGDQNGSNRHSLRRRSRHANGVHPHCQLACRVRVAGIQIFVAVLRHPDLCRFVSSVAGGRRRKSRHAEPGLAEAAARRVNDPTARVSATSLLDPSHLEEGSTKWLLANNYQLFVRHLDLLFPACNQGSSGMSLANATLDSNIPVDTCVLTLDARALGSDDVARAQELELATEVE